MAMDWLKGLVGPMAQFSPTGQPMAGPPGGSAAFPPAYGAPPGGPPMGGAPPGAWGPPPAAWDPNATPLAPPAGTSPTYGAGMPGVDANPYGTPYGSPNYGAPAQAPSYGAPAQPSSYGAPAQAPSYGAPAQAPSYGAPATPQPFGAQPPAAVPAAGTPDARVTALENRCEELSRDLESVALFAQTLLAVLEDKKLLTQQDFQEMRRKLDLMDGRLDDRIAKTP